MEVAHDQRPDIGDELGVEAVEDRDRRTERDDEDVEAIEPRAADDRVSGENRVLGMISGRL